MERYETYGIVILVVLALVMLGWLLHQVLDGDVIREVAGYLVKLTNGLFPVIAHNPRCLPELDRKTVSWPGREKLPQQQAEATFPS